MEGETNGVSDSTEHRVACPSCGRFLLRIRMVKDAATAAFSEEIQCQGKKCHRPVQLTYVSGRVSLAVL